MTRSQKGLLVAGGYVGALLLAAAALWVHGMIAPGPARQAASSMAAFGDSVLFGGTFLLAATPATGLALYFLRSAPRFWAALAWASVAMALTAVAALITLRLVSGVTAAFWPLLAPVRLLGAPALAVAFGLAAAIAPERSSRRLLILAAVIELGAFAGALVSWVAPR
jgi:hypothetical protein